MNPKQAIQYFNLRRDWLGDGGNPVDAELAQQRANVCLQCPMNVDKPIQEFFTAPVVRELRKQIELKNSMQLRVQGEKSLHVCEGCECNMKLKVWCPIEHIKANTETDNLHKNCWILNQ